MRIHGASTCRANGFTLVEVVLAMVVISVMLTAALRVTGASVMAQTASADRLRAVGLAQDLMAEIVSKKYADPVSLGIWGPELTEVLAGRTAFNDVDDYSGYSESPPKDRSGSVIAGCTGWRRSVAVSWVILADPASTSVFDSGLKRITVTVSRNGKSLARLSALRSAAF